MIANFVANVVGKLYPAWCGKFKPRLAERWAEFVNCPKRLEAEGPFLLSLLKGNPLRIFDAATGTGCEAVFLARRGCNVTANEIDRDLARQAKQFALGEAVSIHFTDYNWRDVEKSFEPGSFDVTFILGNSLCQFVNLTERSSWTSGTSLTYFASAAKS